MRLKEGQCMYAVCTIMHISDMRGITCAGVLAECLYFLGLDRARLASQNLCPNRQGS